MYSFKNFYKFLKDLHEERFYILTNVIINLKNVIFAQNVILRVPMKFKCALIFIVKWNVKFKCILILIADYALFDNIVHLNAIYVSCTTMPDTEGSNTARWSES